MRLGSAWLVVSLWLFSNFHHPQAADILGIFPYCQPSPFQVVRPYLIALRNRGHKITVITPMEMLDEIEGIEQIEVPMLNRRIQDVVDFDLFDDFFINKWSESLMASTIYRNMSLAILQDFSVQRMLSDKNVRFDMVILEPSHMDAIYGFAEFYNATLMGFSSVYTDWYTEFLAGNSAPSVYDPISPIGYSLDNSLMSMFCNWVYITEEILLDRLIYRPSQLSIFKEVFGYSAKKLDDLRSSFSVILINNHFSMGRVRANVPNVIEVGGIHLIEPPKPCDEDLQRFLDEAEYGVIYFSMGVDIMVKYLPLDIQQPLLKSFAQLKQKVIWKNELSTIPNKSDNIYVMSKTPQRRILEHPNVRLFITIGGILSVTEAIDSGVPMLGLPLFFDQIGNMHRVQQAGMAMVLDTNSLSAESLTSTILELIENPKYAARAKNMSQSFRDRPMSPLDTAVWWTEYALRHPDVRHIRLNEDDISFMRYYRLESLLSIGLRFGFIIGLVTLLAYKLVQKCNRKQERVRVFRLIRLPIK
ncbi:uncharacterized protein Dana_GF27075 [Drosophila ananassae]|uniref:UDP-glycosyltransferases domain-containing protein n=1 Tax=Drosophila ananassae TaxID=7217 RepID=A0A0P9CBT1_DROAN|nr:UDP-glycosyltransferase UGT5-like [Drosophila ananassae]KPU80574.1 uncharacterized protein Dana_GF27075 [Drosophila ananassae]